MQAAEAAKAAAEGHGDKPARDSPGDGRLDTQHGERGGSGD